MSITNPDLGIAEPMHSEDEKLLEIANKLAGLDNFGKVASVLEPHRGSPDFEKMMELAIIELKKHHNTFAKEDPTDTHLRNLILQSMKRVN